MRRIREALRQSTIWSSPHAVSQTSAAGLEHVLASSEAGDQSTASSLHQQMNRTRQYPPETDFVAKVRCQGMVHEIRLDQGGMLHMPDHDNLADLAQAGEVTAAIPRGERLVECAFFLTHWRTFNKNLRLNTAGISAEMTRFLARSQALSKLRLARRHHIPDLTHWTPPLYREQFPEHYTPEVTETIDLAAAYYPGLQEIRVGHHSAVYRDLIIVRPCWIRDVVKAGFVSVMGTTLVVDAQQVIEVVPETWRVKLLTGSVRGNGLTVAYGYVSRHNRYWHFSWKKDGGW